MILEATRLWVDQCIKHEVRGVNALLPDVPRSGDDDEPPQIKVYDWSRDGWAARMDFQRGKVAPLEAALVIVRASDLMQAPIPGNPELSAQQANVVLAAIYLGRIDAGTEKTVEKAEQDASYTLRAVLRATARWIEETEPNDRVLGQCRLVECTDQSLLTFPTEAGRGVVGQGVIFGARMTDMWAENITSS